MVRLDFSTMIRALEWQLSSAFLQEYSDLVAELATQKLNEFNVAHDANVLEYCAQNHRCQSLEWPKDFPCGSQRVAGVPLTLDAVREVKRLWRDILDESMRDARALLGMTDADASAVQERILFERVNREFGHVHRVLAHGRPDWLRPQHLDVWLPDASVAIEFHGLQHFVPVDYFGGKASFDGQRQRDIRKRQLCDAHGCRLIVVDENYEWTKLRALLARLLDNDPDGSTQQFMTQEFLGAESELAKCIHSAIEDRASLRFLYQKPDGTSACRVMTPIRLEVARGGTQCVRGYCWLRKAERLFALSRMADASVCASEQATAEALKQARLHDDLRRRRPDGSTAKTTETPREVAQRPEGAHATDLFARAVYEKVIEAQKYKVGYGQAILDVHYESDGTPKIGETGASTLLKSLAVAALTNAEQIIAEGESDE